jgi:hypothetical protein
LFFHLLSAVEVNRQRRRLNVAIISLLEYTKTVPHYSYCWL